MLHRPAPARPGHGLTFAFSPPHQHGFQGPHVHILPRQPLEAGHQGQPVSLRARPRAPAPVATSPAPTACSWPARALVPGAAGATGRVPFIAAAVVDLIGVPMAPAGGAGLGGGQLDLPGTLHRLLGEEAGGRLEALPPSTGWSWGTLAPSLGLSVQAVKWGRESTCLEKLTLRLPLGYRTRWGSGWGERRPLAQRLPLPTPPLTMLANFVQVLSI